MNRLTEWLMTVTADNENDVTNLLMIMNPSDHRDQEAAGKAFSAELGYNPITLYDEFKVEDYVNEFIGEYIEADPIGGKIVKEGTTDIIPEIMNAVTENKDSFIKGQVADVMAEKGIECLSNSSAITSLETHTDLLKETFISVFGEVPSILDVDDDLSILNIDGIDDDDDTFEESVELDDDELEL